MELKDFIGSRFELTGVENHPATGDEAGGMSFVLNGTIYTAVEDPEDGYRSSLAEIAMNTRKVWNTFPPCRVRCVADDGEHLVKFVDMDTGKAVLRVGTDHDDSYYPSFVASFSPENMAVNTKPAGFGDVLKAMDNNTPKAEGWATW